MRFSLFAMMAAAANSISIDTYSDVHSVSQAIIQAESEEMFNDFFMQVEDGEITPEEFQILAQMLDGEIDFNDFAQTDAEGQPKRSEGFLAAVNRIKDSALGQLKSFGQKALNGVTAGAQAMANTVSGICTNCSNMLTGQNSNKNKGKGKQQVDSKKKK